MSNNRSKGFKQLSKLSNQLDKVSNDHLDYMIKNRGEFCPIEIDEAIYSLAVEVAYYRKKEQLGYVQ